MSGERRSPLFIITGLVIGIALGVVYAWVLIPDERVDSYPISLREDYKDLYREMIAVAYVASGDLGRAQARLELLGDDNQARTLAVQAQLTLGEEVSPDIARALGILAAHLEDGPGNFTIDIAESPLKVSPSSSPETTLLPTSNGNANQTTSGTPTRTTAPTSTHTPQGTNTPTATQGAPFELLDFELICKPDIQVPLIQVYVFDAANNHVPGIQVVVNWDGGQDSFFTGFKLEFGLGYGDFEMTPGITYTLQLTDGGEPRPGWIAQECPGENGDRYWGSWRLNFVQP